MFNFVRIRKSAVVGALALTVLSGAAACGGGDEKKSNQDATATLDAGLQAHARGNFDAAVVDYNKVIKADSNNKFAYYNLGAIAQAQNRPGEARADYNKTIAIDPNYGPA